MSYYRRLYMKGGMYFFTLVTHDRKPILCNDDSINLLAQSFQYAKEDKAFETEAMTKAYYWRIFGKTKNDPYDRLLLDAKEGYSGKKENVELLLEESFESIADTTTLSKDFSKTGIWSTFTDINKIFSPPTNVPF